MWAPEGGEGNSEPDGFLQCASTRQTRPPLSAESMGAPPDMGVYGVFLLLILRLVLRYNCKPYTIVDTVVTT